uniref:Uncharacterized protein n=1 Tax=Timema monikensis TaxID=170555 RepID=A0A7R9HLJ2_9NEOP|nr:unnamed protein product [Timema monikensis]
MAEQFIEGKQSKVILEVRLDLSPVHYLLIWNGTESILGRAESSSMTIRAREDIVDRFLSQALLGGPSEPSCPAGVTTRELNTPSQEGTCTSLCCTQGLPAMMDPVAPLIHGATTSGEHAAPGQPHV